MTHIIYTDRRIKVEWKPVPIKVLLGSVAGFTAYMFMSSGAVEVENDKGEFQQFYMPNSPKYTEALLYFTNND